ncbi:disks large-associated protein 5 isoform X2 [Chelonia mydas]|uniref:disks large-associated protein 5 isoform X2 n=2 Tax=Chelonia mydas TaxID=8469 RepID=UPI001CA7EBFB|nr:disks large-associated protein 5 isoform X2 [Chelonia mydas]
MSGRREARIVKMAATSQFANRYRKDLSTETLRTKVARRKSLIQKENRYKQFERSRQFGLADVNVQLSKDRGLPKLDETNEVRSQEKTTAKRKQTTNGAVNKSENERKEMLQRYKEEKELRKLKQQREKAKRGVFKVGLYRPNVPGFLPFVPQNPVIVKPKEKAAPTSSARITRSQAKSHSEQTVMSARSQQSMIYADHATNGYSVRPTQTGRRQTCADKVTEKKKVVVQPELPTASNVRITRSTSSTLTKQMSKPATTMTLGNQQQKKSTSRGKQQKEVKAENVEAHKHEVEGNTLMDQLTEVSVSNSKNPTSEVHQEETLLEKENISVTHIPVPLRQRTRSFAPQNFVFQPLDGLTTYKVTPMTPSRANAFLTPCLSWSPMKIEANISKEESRKECLFKSQVSPAQEGTDKSSQEQQIGTHSLKVKNECVSTKTQDAMQSSNKTSPVSADIPAIETKGGETDHDVPYFRNVLASETERLMSHCLQWDGKFDLDIPEDAKDLIRTTVGQTRLLIAERFKQFEGLVDNCEFKWGDKATTCTDLDGFWDMVSFQVEDVNKKFDNLSKLQENGWQPVNIPSKRAIKKAVPSGISKLKQGAAGRTAARNRIAAIRAAMKEKMKQGETAADSAAQEMPKEEEKVVFEAGFFRIESPLKSLPALPSKTPGRSSQRISKQLTTPGSASRTLLQSSLAILCSSEDAVAKQTPPSASGFHVPENPNRLQAPTRKTLFGSTLEQSGSPLAEEQCSATDGAAERNKRTNETNVSVLEVCLHPDERRSSGPVDSQALEDPGTKIEMPDITEEMELSATDLTGQDIVMHSPEKNVQPETDFIQAEKPNTPEYTFSSDLLHSDFISSDGTPFDMPSLDCSLPFTPVRNEAQKVAAAEICNDLIVFSPLSLPSVEK